MNSHDYKSFKDRLTNEVGFIVANKGPLNLFAVGALTAGSSEEYKGNGAKPHTFRPWEVESIDSIDLMDSSLGSVRFQMRGGKIMRVLPRVNDHINGEWATDKGRYAPLDGVNTQEVRKPRLKVGGTSNVGSWVTVSLNKALEACDSLDNKSRKNTKVTKRVIYGATTDCESITSMESWASSNHSHLNSLVPNLNSISKKTGLKIFNTGFNTEDETSIDLSIVQNQETFLPNNRKNVLLIGCDPRIQSPLLNLRLREFYLNGTEFWSLGSLGYQTYPVRSIGLGSSGFNRLIKNSSQYPKWDLILVGIDVFMRKDAEFIANEIKVIAGDQSIRICTTRANENYIRFHSGTKPYTSGNQYDVQYLVNLTENEIKSAGLTVDDILSEAKKTIILTYKGANWMKKASIILPILNPLEFKGSYISRFGGVRVSEIVLNRNETSKDIYSRSNLFDMRNRVGKQIAKGTLDKYTKDNVLPLASVNTKNVVKSPFMVSIQDYHVEGHPFAECSSTRAHCSTVFATSQGNFF